MKDGLDCNIVRDILPLYVENLTSEESNAAIVRHLEHCDECRSYLEILQEPLDCPAVPQKEIDYMRKVKASLKRRARIITCLTVIAGTLLCGLLLRLFIIGTQISVDNVPITYEWNYNPDDGTFTIHGSLGLANTGVRVKVYEDKQDGQIRIRLYETIPSPLFPDDEFSLKLHWDAEQDIVWQDQYNQNILMAPRYLNLIISQYKDGQYMDVIDIFDMDGTTMIQQLYDNAEELSEYEPAPFDWEGHDEYLTILLLPTSGVSWYEEGMEEISDSIILYQQDGQYYFYREGQHLRKLKSEDANKISDYIASKAF